jgi:hypothetical protein
MKKWEYNVLELSRAASVGWITQVLDDEGEKGWELVCCNALDVLIFKRPKQAEVEVVDMEGERPPMTQFPNV